ncbi:hypothetical protein J2T16_003094 [Paenibacillus intestini]|nr:hypothetical protein [Paenibacillus intestini]
MRPRHQIRIQMFGVSERIEPKLRRSGWFATLAIFTQGA